ncbi:NTP transferase domain-containing protein [Sphingomonas morindae]|uniref:NTP transferase domain-containing protein n=1 Tax=Sphingomonas morindae TaxID=1541170 RepID=A0ABY4X6J5_9SPHN|nr:NTP transferase domain-containing protein [Sphingomonas morindae]USI72506.1 NTP transferase domain-containing protein [Sphingomonas morindae]
MRRLGAILAGGAASRFGGDKAAARLGGRALLDHVALALGGWCDALVVVGRDWPGLTRVEDLPRPGLGPLGGLAGALAHAARHGFDTVLSCGCDLPRLPPALPDLLGPPDAILADQPTIGHWRSRQAEPLAAWLEAVPRHAVRAWAMAAGARLVAGPPLANINRPEDLARLAAGPEG